jgi:hypothetical protein
MNKQQQEKFAELKQRFRTRPYGSQLSDEERKELQQFHQIEKMEDRLQFGSDYDWMVETLYKHDPIRLVPCEVPKDEYENEGSMILRRLADLKPRTIETIQQMVWEVFDKQFSISADAGGKTHYHSEAGKPTDAVYEAIAKEMYAKFCA